MSSIRGILVIMPHLCWRSLWLWTITSPLPLIRGYSLRTMVWGKTKTNWVFFQMLLAIGKLSTKSLQESSKVAKINTFSTYCYKLCKYWKEERDAMNVHGVEFTFGKLSRRELVQSCHPALHSQALLVLQWQTESVFKRHFEITLHFRCQETVCLERLSYWPTSQRWWWER